MSPVIVSTVVCYFRFLILFHIIFQLELKSTSVFGVDQHANESIGAALVSMTNFSHRFW